MKELMMNIISISNELINNNLKNRLLSLAKPYLIDYSVDFSDGHICLDLRLRIKTIGDLTAKYMIKVADFTFNEQYHTVRFNFLEDVKSDGNPMQKIMLKAAGLKDSTFLQTAAAMLNPPGITVEGKSCSVDFDQFVDLKNGILSKISLQYLDSRSGTLQLSFNIRDL